MFLDFKSGWKVYKLRVIMARMVFYFWNILTPLCTQVSRSFWSNFHAFVYVTLCVCCVISSQITADTHVTYWNLAIIVEDTKSQFC